MLYNVVLVSTVQQSESATRIYVSAPGFSSNKAAQWQKAAILFCSQSGAHDEWGLGWVIDSRQHHSLTTWLLCVARLPPQSSVHLRIHPSPLTSFLNTSSPFLPLALPAPGMLCPRPTLSPGFLHSLNLNILCFERPPGPAGPSPHLLPSLLPVRSTCPSGRSRVSCSCLSLCAGSSARARMGLRVHSRCWRMAWRPHSAQMDRCPALSTGPCGSTWCSHMHTGSQLGSLGHVP